MLALSIAGAILLRALRAKERTGSRSEMFRNTARGKVVTYVEEIHAHSQVRASPAPRFVLDAAAHVYGSAERQQVVRLAVDVERYRLPDDADTEADTDAIQRRHFRTPDREVLINESKHSRTTAAAADERRPSRANVHTEQRVAGCDIARSISRHRSVGFAATRPAPP